MNIARVGDIATQIRGVTFSKGDSRDSPCEGYLPVVRANNIKDDGLDLSEFVYVPVSKIRDNQRLRSNDVVVSSSSGSLSSVGKAAYVANSMDVAWGAFLKVLRPGGQVDGKYFSHFFRTDSYRRNVSALAAGVNINNLKKEHLDNLQMRLPPLGEQRRISGILDQADAIRTKRRASLALLDELTQSVFLDLSVSSEPQKMRFGDLVQNFRNGLSPSNSGEFGAQVLTLGAITHGRFDPTSRRAAMFDRIPEENVRVRKQDFLVCRGNGNIDLVGQGVFPQSDDDQVVFPDTMIACRLDADKIRPPYLAALWGQRVVRQQIEVGARTTNGTFKINQKILGDVSLPIPPLAVQQEFAARVEKINAQRALVERALEKDEELFASLQSRAFSGEL